MTGPVGSSRRAYASVPTETAARFAKQLSSHFGRKSEAAAANGRTAEVRHESDGPRLILPFGSCLLITREDALELHAEAADTAGLQKVQDVVGRHLEQFGQRQGLVVAWSPAD